MPTAALSRKRTERTALLVLTRRGLELARRVQHGLTGDVHIYASQRALKTQDHTGPVMNSTITCFESVAALLANLWQTQDQFVLFFSLGAAVRLIAPHLRDKHVDPAVVVIDDAGTFAISVVSGHVRGANALAARCAAILGAQPVVTTASEVHNTVALDMLAREQGWYVEATSALTSVAAAIVNGERVAVFQDAGSLDWQASERFLSAHLVQVAGIHEATAAEFAALLIISDRLGEDLPATLPTVVCRPPTLVLGVGCRHGVPFAELDAWIKATLTADGIAFHSITTLASATVKGDEEGLQLLAQRSGWNFEVHAIEALRTVTEVPSPSERVQQLIGTPSVCEAAAILSSRGGELVMPKQKGTGMTLAVARRPAQHDNTHAIHGQHRTEATGLLPIKTQGE
ncbi:MAG: cobalamin biosynthesis protein [Ktedonobacteraceae bacterium]